MDLDEWLWKKKISQQKFSDKIGISHINLHHIICRKTTAKLRTAIKILEHTNNEVDLKNLLSEKDCKKYDIPFYSSR